MEKHILSVLVQNKAGVLSKVVGLFSRRGFNIDSLAVGETHDPAYSRITIITSGDEKTAMQIIRQLEKLTPVEMVRRLDDHASVSSELCIVKVVAERGERSEIMQIVDIFHARIIDVSHRTITIEMTGKTDRVEALLNMVEPFGIIELSRTGSVALERGEHNIYDI
ncbi:MAG: acetolactate synthase small subunit [Clostridia bacterium]|nr:acetolactate synthase small subunit [Clostridia bacterium]